MRTEPSTLAAEKPDDDFISILCCPATGKSLRPGPAGWIETPDGVQRYAFADGIYDFLGDTSQENPDLGNEKSIVREFYETYGWEKNREGLYKDTTAFVALSAVARDYTRECNYRIGDLFSEPGRYFLDAGSGAIPWPEYLRFHENFDIRICVDISRAALLEAKRKLGDRGRYVLADLTRLPFRDTTIDAAAASHVFYHIPADEQHKAFAELARVLTHAGRATVTYSWSSAPLAWALTIIFRLLSLLSRGPYPSAGASSVPEDRPALYYHAHSRRWFETQAWPFEYRLESFRLIDNRTMRRYFRDTWLWRTVVKALLLMQKALPAFSGKYGKYPLIIIKGSGRHPHETRDRA